MKNPVHQHIVAVIFDTRFLLAANFMQVLLFLFLFLKCYEVSQTENSQITPLYWVRVNL